MTDDFNSRRKSPGEVIEDIIDWALDVKTNQVEILQQAVGILEDVTSTPEETPVAFAARVVTEEDDSEDEFWEEEFEPGFEPAESKTPMGPSGLRSTDLHSEETSRAAFLPKCLQDQPLSATIQQRLAERRIFIPGTGPHAPEITARIPISLWIFGIKLNGILDTGSERSYINAKVYEDIQDYASGELRPDETNKRGILLANHTLCKSQGGAPFIIQVGTVAGEQYMSVLNGLGHSVVLGMDFALQFKIIIDCNKKIWRFTDSPEVYPVELLHSREKVSRLSTMVSSESDCLEKFLKQEIKKFKNLPNNGLTQLIEHEIVLKINAVPVKVKPYRRSPVINQELHRQVDELLEKGFVRPSYSVWSCSPVMVAKPNNTWRFCVDYRPVNKVTIPPAHPLPNMLRILSALHGANYISTIDLKEAFHQIRMAKESIPLTAFSVEGKGQFEWLRMPYGLVGAPSTFQKAMDLIQAKFRRMLVQRGLPQKWACQVFVFLQYTLVLTNVIAVIHRSYK